MRPNSIVDRCSKRTTAGAARLPGPLREAAAKAPRMQGCHRAAVEAARAPGLLRAAAEAPRAPDLQALQDRGLQQAEAAAHQEGLLPPPPSQAPVIRNREADK